MTDVGRRLGDRFDALPWPHKLLVPTFLLMILGAIGPWVTGTPWALWADPPPETWTGLHDGGVLFLAAAALGLALLGIRTPWIRGATLTLLGLGSTWFAWFSWTWLDFFRLDITPRWGIYVVVVTSVVVLALAVAGTLLELIASRAEPRAGA